MYLVSSCLAGVNCRYNGGNSKNKIASKLVEEGKAIPICPEVLGGLSTPRACCEMITDKKGNKRVISKEGKDCTSEFVIGAEKTLKIAQIIGAKIAILQSKSPSCGYGFVYDGSFSRELIEGNGFTADLLSKNGITIYNENDIEKLDL